LNNPFGLSIWLNRKIKSPTVWSADVYGLVTRHSYRLLHRGALKSALFDECVCLAIRLTSQTAHKLVMTRKTINLA